MIRSALILLLATSVHAGLPIAISDTSWPGGTVSYENLLPPGIALRWRSTDLANTTSVSNWIDEIQSYHWTQTTNGSMPTWTTNGVYFNGGNILVATNMDTWTATTETGSGVTPTAWLLIGRYYSTVPGSMFFADRWEGGRIFIGIGDVDSYFYEGTRGNSAVGALSSDVDFDLLTCKTTLSPNAYQFYTNGVSGWETNSGWNAGASKFSQVGLNLQGLIKEVIVWSNAVFTTTQVANIHSYATNVYTPSYLANSAVFDGSNDYMRLSSAGPSGLADGKQFTVSFWVKFAGANGSGGVILDLGTGGTVRLLVSRNASDQIRLLGVNSASSAILDLHGSSSVTSASGWVHIYACIDLTDTAKRKIYINGVAETLTVTTYSNDTIDFVGASHLYTVGADLDTPPVFKLNAALSEFWFNDAYFDDPTKFISGGRPISLGSDGSTPTGSQPVFYFRRSGDSFAVNQGTGGNFTVTGSLGTTIPP